MGSGKGKTTSNVRRSQANRVRRNRANKDAQQAEAAALGISVQDLIQRKFAEAREIVKRQQVAPPPRTSYSSFRY